jgi:hypothetical protein
MRSLTFEFKPADMLLLRKFYKRAPNEYKRVMANMMTAFAFGTRAVSLNIIRKHMVVRNNRFVNSRVRVQKAVSGRMRAIVGSVRGPRFTGWEEQEGAPTQRTRVFGIMARRGDIHRTAIGVSRLKPGADHIEPDDYQGRTERFRNTAMLMDIRRRKIKKPFVIRRHSKIKPGLYRFVRNKLQMLQRFKFRKQPQKVKWMSGAVPLYMTRGRVRNEWAKSIRHVLKLK